MIIDNAGTYILRYTATDDCGKTTTVDRELVVAEPVHVYGAEWDGSSSPVWTRTGLSADFADPVPSVNNGTGSSPFDEIYPWSGMQIVEDAEAGTLVSIPKFYYKWTQGFGENENSLRLEISDSPQEGFFASPAHADRGDGVGERDVVYVGRYHCVSGFKSVSGSNPYTGQGRTRYRTGIHNLGNDVWQHDIAMFWTIRMLYLVEFANWNSQAIIGYGCGNGSSKDTNGTTDSMQYHTGTTASSRSEYGHVQYRHIEGLWSNVREWVDGIIGNGSNVYAINNPSLFSNDSSQATYIGTSERKGVNRVNNGFKQNSIEGFEYLLLPINTAGVDSTYDDYVTDYADGGSSTSNNLLTGGGYNIRNKESGLFLFDLGKDDTNWNANIGSRLMKLPSA